jgi:hypothetical protein
MIKTFFILRPSKIYPSWDFWFENIPSGNLVPNNVQLQLETSRGRRFPVA